MITKEQIKLREKYVALNKKATGIQDLADLEERALTAKEEAEIEGILAECQEIEFQFSSPSQGRQAEPQQPEPQNRGRGRGGEPGGATTPAGYEKFRSDGEFFQAVRNSCARGGSIDPRLIMGAPTSVGTEGVGEDGGFAVPPRWSKDILMTIAGEGSLMSFCQQVPTPTNNYYLVKDDGAPWATSGGIQAYWGSEAGQLTQSKPSLKGDTLRLKKLTALVPVSDELLEDAPSLDAYLKRKTSSIFDFKVNLALLQGTGAGVPLGVLNSSALITVDKLGGQNADTIFFENIIDMWGGLASGSENRAIWLVHKDAWPQLMRMSLGVGLSGQPVFLPPDAAAGRPFSSLMGRPVITTQACNQLGDKGDIILVDLSQYLVAYKSQGMRTDISMHLWFDYDVLAYRFILRLDGQPLWASTVTARSGSTEYSPYVTLEERA